MIQELHSFTKRTVAEHSLLMSLDANMMKQLFSWARNETAVLTRVVAWAQDKTPSPKGLLQRKQLILFINSYFQYVQNAKGYCY